MAFNISVPDHTPFTSTGVKMAGHECDICGQEFEEEKGKYIHMGMEHPDDVEEEIGLVCPSCGKEFESSKVLETHRSEIHSQASSSGPSQVGVYFRGVLDKDTKTFLTDYWKSLTFILLIAAFVILQSGSISLGGGGPQAASPGGSPSGEISDTNASGTGGGGVPAGVPDELPEKTKYNSCEVHKDCASTCCGAYNQEHMDRCSEMPPCSDGQLMISSCVEGRCVSTDQPVPEEAIQ